MKNEIMNLLKKQDSLWISEIRRRLLIEYKIITNNHKLKKVVKEMEDEGLVSLNKAGRNLVVRLK